MSNFNDVIVIPNISEDSLSSIAESVEFLQEIATAESTTSSVEVLQEIKNYPGITVTSTKPSPKSIKIKSQKKRLKDSFMRFLAVEKKAKLKDLMVAELKKNKKAIQDLLAETESENKQIWNRVEAAKATTQKLKDELESLIMDKPERPSSAASVESIEYTPTTNHFEPIPFVREDRKPNAFESIGAGSTQKLAGPAQNGPSAIETNGAGSTQRQAGFAGNGPKTPSRPNTPQEGLVRQKKCDILSEEDWAVQVQKRLLRCCHPEKRLIMANFLEDAMI